MKNPEHDPVTLALSPDEALVLFELVARFDKEGDRSQALSFEHAAERAALWALHAALERDLVSPFRSEYAQLLEAARARLREKSGL